MGGGVGSICNQPKPVSTDHWRRGGLMVSSPDRAIRLLALAGDIVLCSWERHPIFTVPLSIEMGTGEFSAGGNPAMD